MLFRKDSCFTSVALHVAARLPTGLVVESTPGQMLLPARNAERGREAVLVSSQDR